MAFLGLYTDLYELTMAQAYLEEGKEGTAVFSLFVRKLPPVRNFLVSAGLSTFIERLSEFKFGEEELKFLKGTGLFKESFLDYLREFEFSGSLYAIREGRVFFQNEPLLQVEAPLPEAQILETIAINTLHFQTLIASKAVRCYLASEGRTLVDFGLRRAHGLEAGLYGARASFIAGFSGTSNLEASRRFSIPPVGTMAHSFVMVFGEEEAFKVFAKLYPDKAVYLIDTYDTVEGAKKVVKLAKEGLPVVGVRIDSGDVPALTKEVKRILKEAGLEKVKIVVSGGVDEYKIKKWLEEGAPIDAFGVGTKFITSADAPYLDMAYKLVEYEGEPKFKLSPGKKTFPYKRQVYRLYEGGKMKEDKVVRWGEKEEGEPLVEKVTEGGRLLKPLPSLKEARELLLRELEKLPEPLKEIEEHHPYPVKVF